jgi:mono/diheme cytochrome c family protein
MTLLALWACDPATPPQPGGPGDPARGRAVYATSCTACHHVDPALPGAIGPEVKGASRELLEARIVHGTYPAGYTPKRPTALMQPLPQLAGSVDDLTAYLAAP